MLIAELFLSKLTRLLSVDESRELDPCQLQVASFHFRERDWACLIAEPTQETWFFQPFQSDELDRELLPSPKGSDFSLWKLNEPLTARVQKSIAKFCDQCQIADLSHHFLVIRNDSDQDVLAANCIRLNLVAVTLRKWGNPPESVKQDWAHQLTLLSHSHRPSTAETLVTPDGILVPWFSILSNHDPFNFNQNRFDRPSDLMPAPNWPMPFESAMSVEPTKLVEPTKSVEREVPRDRTVPSIPSGLTTALKSIEPSRIESSSFVWSPPGNRKSESTRPKRLVTIKKSRWLPIVGLVALIAVGSSAVWFLIPDAKLAANKTINGPADTTVRDVAEQVEPELMELIIDGGNPESAAEPNPQPSELTSEKLLAQLGSTKDDSFNLNSMSTSSIISQTLAPVGGTDLANGFNSVDATDESESMDTPDSASMATVQSETGTITLERPLRIQAAVIKENVSIGKPVLPKACRCEIELKLAGKNLVVEPTESVSIEGIGTTRWKIGIEDEEPELIVEISSKPGSKWQFVTKVGLLESAKAMPVLIGPRDAQNVGNRLIQFQEMINISVEELRTARSNNRGRSTIDYAGEIKRLEQMGREAKKALERWKVIARLCHFFFDSNEVRFQFVAIEKPSSTP